MVSAWVAVQDQSSLYLNAIVVGELRKGLSLLPEGKRRMHLDQWLENSLLPLFANRVLPITQSIGNRWGILSAQRQLQGLPLNMADGLIAATALEYELTLITRNERDFANLGVQIIHPWNV